jgi:hypothetical protein
MSLTITATSRADLLAQVADLTGATPGTGTGTDGGTTTTPPPAVDMKDPDNWDDATVKAKFFPADSGMALFPSPEGSRITVDPDGTLSGPPYLLDALGNRYRFDRNADGIHAAVLVSNIGGGTSKLYGAQVSFNGTPVPDTSGRNLASGAFTKIMIAQGKVYMTAFGGQTLIINGGVSSLSVTAQPVAWSDPFYGYKSAHNIGTGDGSTGSTGGGGGVPIPADPPAPAVKPGSNGNVLKFGTGQTYAGPTAALAAAKPGDTVLFAGTPGQVFTESFDVPEGVKLDGGGRWPADMSAVKAIFAAGSDYSGLDALYTAGAVIDGNSLSDPDGYSHQLGGVIPLGNAIATGLRIKNFGLKEAQHGGTGGIRMKGNGIGQMQGSDNYITDCQNGIGPGGTQIISGPWVRTVIVRCGLDDGAGGAHCVYDTSSTVRSIAGPDFYADGGSLSGSAGHGYKSRAGASFTAVAPFYIKGSDSSALDIPNGSAAVCQVGAGDIEQYGQAGFTNHTLIGYGLEGAINGTAGVKCSGTTFHGNCPAPVIQGAGPIDVTGCTFLGTKPAGASNVTGLS